MTAWWHTTGAWVEAACAAARCHLPLGTPARCCCSQRPAAGSTVPTCRDSGSWGRVNWGRESSQPPSPPASFTSVSLKVISTVLAPMTEKVCLRLAWAVGVAALRPAPRTWPSGQLSEAAGGWREQAGDGALDWKVGGRWPQGCMANHPKQASAAMPPLLLLHAAARDEPATHLAGAGWPGCSAGTGPPHCPAPSGRWRCLGRLEKGR